MTGRSARQRRRRLSAGTMTEESSPGTGRRVLIVDDHDGFRALARRLLESAGFAVSEASTGSEGAAAAVSQQPSLVLLDVQLPDLDGFAVADLLAEHAPTTVVVLTSTRDAADFGGRIAVAPVAGFVAKHELSAAVLHRLLEEVAP